MKISDRDLTALSALLLAGIIYIMYTFLFSPLFPEISLAKENLDALKETKKLYTQMQEEGTLASLEAQQAALVEKAEEKSAAFLPDLEQEKIIMFVRNLASEQGLTVSSVFFSIPEIYDTAPKTGITGSALPYPAGAMASVVRSSLEGSDAVTSETYTAPAANAGTEPNVNSVLVDVRFTDATYPQIAAFMERLESYKRTIYCSSISIETSTTGAGLVASLQYRFVSLEKVSSADSGLSAVPNVIGLGKPDPFQ